MPKVFWSALLSLVSKHFFFSGYNVIPSDISPSVYNPCVKPLTKTYQPRSEGANWGTQFSVNY